MFKTLCLKTLCLKNIFLMLFSRGEDDTSITFYTIT